MSSSLGAARQNNFRMTVANGLGVVMPRGTVVAFHNVAGGAGGVPTAVYSEVFINRDFGAGTIPPIDAPVFPVNVAPADTTTAGNATVIGVTAHDILPGKIGEIITYGPAYVLTGGIVSTGEVISSDGTGRAVDTGTTLRNPFGLAMTAATAANQLIIAFINCINNGTTGAFFMGKAF